MMIGLLILLLGTTIPPYHTEQLGLTVVAFEKQTGAMIRVTDTDAIPNLVGKTVVASTGLPAPQETVWMHMDSDGRIFDVTWPVSGHTDLLTPQSVAFQILQRLMWVAAARDLTLFRANVRLAGIEIRSNALLNEEQRVERLHAWFSQGLHSGSDIRYSDADGLTATFTRRNEEMTIAFWPTLNLALNGDVELYRRRLIGEMRSENPIIPARMSNEFRIDTTGSAKTAGLPSYGLYVSEWSVDETGRWIGGSAATLDSLAALEPWIPQHAAFWASMGSVGRLVARSVRRSDNYRLSFTIPMEPVHNATFETPDALLPMMILDGERIPVYYGISTVQREGEIVRMEGFVMVFHPAFHYQHILRVTDQFVVTSGRDPVWVSSHVTAILTMRSDQIRNLNAPNSALGSLPGMPNFSIRMRP